MNLSEPSAKKAKRSKNFQHQWFNENPQWKTWVEHCPSDPKKFVCIACKCSLSCGYSQIERHSQSKSHSKNMLLLNISRDSSNVSGNSQESSSTSSSPELDFNERLKAAEIRYAYFLVQNNIPLTMAPQILNFFQSIGQEPAVLQKMTMGKTKATGIVNNVVSVHESQRVEEVLRKTKFSAHVDETSDNTSDKWMSLMVRYVDPNSLLAKTELVQLIHVDATDCSAKRLVEEFEKALEKKAIPLEQLIGLACDNASVTVGKYNSFKTHLTKRLPHLMTLPCICHSLALIAKEACSAIPEEIQSFISKIPTFINSSPKRLAIFHVFQHALEDHPSKLLRFAPTRWLSRQIAITRILNNWENLRIFLTDQVVEKVATAADLLEIMDKPMTKAYLLFLKFALDPLEKTNAYFQGSATLVHQLQPSSKKLLIDVLQRFIKPALLKPEIINNEARNIDFGSITNQRDAFKVDVGDDCKDYLQAQQSSGVSESIIDQVNRNCLKFFVIAAEQIRERLPFDHKFLSDLTVFTSEITLLDSDRESSVSQVENVCRELNVPQVELLREEWRSLFDVDSNLKERWCQLSFDDMRKEICTFTTSDGIVKFPTLRLLLSVIRALPHSNAPAERAFSFIPDTKTKKRNCLSNETLNSLCVVRSVSKSWDQSPAEMVIDKSYIQMMTSCNLYPEKKEFQSQKMNLFAYDCNDECEMNDCSENK